MTSESNTFNTANFDSRLKDWRNDLVDKLETSAANTIDTHAGKLSGKEMSTTQKIESEVGKIMDVALNKVDEMKSHGIDLDRIRESILPAIQNMASPYDKGSDLNNVFQKFQEDAFDRVDAEILGNDQVSRRNLRM